MKIFRCPRCGKGKLYKGLLAISDQCDACGLSFANHEQGDGPAFFGILLIGALTGIFAAILEVKFSPPLWVHAVIWIPFIVIGSLMALRIGKAALIWVQFRSGRLDS